MNKKFMNALLFSAALLSSGVIATSCKDYDDDIDELRNQDQANQASLTEKLSAVESSISSLQSAQTGLQTSIDEAKKAAEEAKVAGDEAKALAEEAKAAGQPGKWLFTLHNASRLPFLVHKLLKFCGLRFRFWQGVAP